MDTQQKLTIKLLSSYFIIIIFLNCLIVFLTFNTYNNPPLCKDTTDWKFNGTLEKIYTYGNLLSLKYNFNTTNNKLEYNCVYISATKHDYSQCSYNINAVVYRECAYLDTFINNTSCYTGSFKRGKNYISWRYTISQGYLSGQLYLGISLIVISMITICLLLKN